MNIGIDIDLKKLLSSRALIEATSGNGKSYLVRKLIESIGNQYQQIVLDPEDEFLTIREKFNFALISVSGGDIPLNIRYAETIAVKLLETNMSAIIALYELKHHERILFVERFLTGLINARRELWHNCFIHIDEAHLWAPESNKSAATGALIDLCTRGRKRGFAAILATQRLSKLHKDAAAECLNKFIGNTSLDIDLKRAAAELGITSREEMNKIRHLKPGEFFAYGPAISNDVTQFKVAPVITTHVKAGSAAVATPPTPEAIKKILSTLQNLPEEAEQDLETKEQLQREVTRLRTELTKLQNSDDGKMQSDIEILNKENEQLHQRIYDLQNRNSDLINYQSRVSVTAEEIEKIYREAVDRFNTTLTKLADVKEIINSLPDQMEPIEKIDKPQLSDAKENHRAEVVKEPERKMHRMPYNVPMEKRIEMASSISSNGNIPDGERKILIACAQFNGCTKDELTTFTGYKRSTRDAYLQRMRPKGYIQEEGNKVRITTEGLKALGSYERLPTGRALQKYWMDRLPAGEAMVLKVILDAYPNDVSRDAITEKTGYQRSTRDAYLQRMVNKRLYHVTSPGRVKANSTLF